MRKNILHTTQVICFLLLIGIVSCKKEPAEIIPELEISTSVLAFDKNGGSKSFLLTSNVDWQISGEIDWYTVGSSSGGAGSRQIAVQVQENTRAETREGILKITAGTIIKEVKITQLQGDELSLAKKIYEIAAAGGKLEIELTASSTPKITADKNWITQSSVKQNETEIIFVFDIAENQALNERRAQIEFSVDDLKESALIIQESSEPDIPADKSGMETDIFAIAKQMGIGWNLGNSLEACAGPDYAGETMWGNAKTTKTLIDSVKKAGFSAIRIPCAWSGYIENKTTHKIQESWLARVKEVVDYCMENDMYAILNIHWDGGWLEENPVYAKQQEINEKQWALWRQIAEYFRDYDEKLLFAGTNEVHYGDGEPTAENIEVQQSYLQTFVDAVRKTGGKNIYRTLVVQSYATNIGYAVDFFEMPDDYTSGRMMMEVHYYDPWDFCGLENDASWATAKYLWGKEGGYGQYGEISDWGQEDWVRDRFSKMKTHFSDKGYPVILGEFGATHREMDDNKKQTLHDESRNYFLNYVTKIALQHNMVPFYWDNGFTGKNGSGIFDRATGKQVYRETVKSLTHIDN